MASTGFAGRSEIVAANVIGYLDRGAPATRYDFAFLDPPFADVAILEATLAHPTLPAALAPDATVIARVLRKHPPTVPPSAQIIRTKQIGEEDLVFLRYSGARGGG